MCIFLDKWYGICIFCRKNHTVKHYANCKYLSSYYHMIILTSLPVHCVVSDPLCLPHLFSIFLSATRCLIFSGMLWFLRTALGSKMSFSNEQDWQSPKILQSEGEIQRQSWNASWRLLWAPLELQNDVKAVDRKCDNFLAHWLKMWKFSR